MQKKQNLGVGIIGAGFIGELHIESIRRLENAKVVAIAEVSRDLAKEKSIKLNIPKYYSDYRDLVLDKDVEVVHIASPNNLHFSQSLFTSKANKHIICEKPLALNSIETYKLLKTVKKIKNVNSVNFNSRFYPLIKVIRNMIEVGDLGNIYSISGSFLQDWMLYKTDYNWRSDPKLGGKLQVVATIGSHWLDLVQYLTDLKIKKVCADFKIIHNIRAKKNENNKDINIQVQGEDIANILLRFSKDIPGIVTFSQISAGKKLELKIGIFGEKCSIEWNSERPNEMWIGRRDKSNSILIKDPSLARPEIRQFYNLPGGHTEGYADTFKSNFKNIYEYILKRDDNEKCFDFATFEDGHDVQLIMDTILKSAESNKWLDVKRSQVM